jgi:hypothetical protein
MREFVYEFGVLEPIDSNHDFSDKVTEQVFPTLFSILSPERWLMCYWIAHFAESGQLRYAGRYRIEMRYGFSTQIRARLRRFV